MSDPKDVKQNYFSREQMLARRKAEIAAEKKFLEQNPKEEEKMIMCYDDRTNAIIQSTGKAFPLPIVNTADKSVIFGSIKFDRTMMNPDLTPFDISSNLHNFCTCKGCVWCTHVRIAIPAQHGKCKVQTNNIGLCAYCTISSDIKNRTCAVPNCGHTCGVSIVSGVKVGITNFCSWHHNRSKLLEAGKKLKTENLSDSWLAKQKRVVDYSY